MANDLNIVNYGGIDFDSSEVKNVSIKKDFGNYSGSLYTVETTHGTFSYREFPNSLNGDKKGSIFGSSISNCTLESLKGTDKTDFYSVKDVYVGLVDLSGDNNPDGIACYGNSKVDKTKLDNIDSVIYCETEKTTAKNDKRPEADHNFKKWINGSYPNVKPGTLKEDAEGNTISFVFYEYTEDGTEEIKVTIKRTDDNRSIIKQDRFGNGKEVCYYEIDNTSGKVLSKQTSLDLPRRVYDENGNIYEDNVSLADMMR